MSSVLTVKYCEDQDFKIKLVNAFLKCEKIRLRTNE